MASTKEIQNRINSIQDTMKITRAMYMMSSMKLRKARKKLEETEPFFQGTQIGLAECLAHFPDIRHIYFDNRIEDDHETTKKHGIIVFTGDKGMAGAYNHNAIKTTVDRIKGMAEGDECTLFVVGEVGRAFFKNGGYNVDEKFRFSSNNPTMHRARVMAEYMIDLYNKGELDRIDVIYTKMLNSITEEMTDDAIKAHSSLLDDHFLWFSPRQNASFHAIAVIVYACHVFKVKNFLQFLTLIYTKRIMSAAKR